MSPELTPLLLALAQILVADELRRREATRRSAKSDDTAPKTRAKVVRINARRS